MQIVADGYARWYTIPEEAFNKTLAVTIPEKAAYVVYDTDGKCVNDSYLSGEESFHSVLKKEEVNLVKYFDLMLQDLQYLSI